MRDSIVRMNDARLEKEAVVGLLYLPRARIEHRGRHGRIRASQHRDEQRREGMYNRYSGKYQHIGLVKEIKQARDGQMMLS